MLEHEEDQVLLSVEHVEQLTASWLVVEGGKALLLFHLWGGQLCQLGDEEGGGDQL